MSDEKFIATDEIFEISNKHVIKILSAKLHIFGKIIEFDGLA